MSSVVMPATVSAVSSAITAQGFPKTLKTKEDYYNCLAMVAAGELAAADLLAKIESAEAQRYIQCAVAEAQPEKKAVTLIYCDEAAVGMKFTAGGWLM